MSELNRTENDTQTLQENKSRGEQELLEQLLDPKVQESLTVLIKELPKLTEMVLMMSESYDTVQSLVTDEVLKNDTLEMLQEIVDPVKTSVKSVAATVIEAKDEAEKSEEVIGVFGLLKMLKDPQAQKLFRFFNAYLKVANERSN